MRRQAEDVSLWLNYQYKIDLEKNVEIGSVEPGKQQSELESPVKVLKAIQQEQLNDAVQAKLSMSVPVLEATLGSLARDRADRFGGYASVTLADLARETREGTGDAGICFELAVHQAIETRNRLIHPLVSEVLDHHMGIKENAESILFGPEKNHIIPILESTQNSLTDESRVWVGNRGQPPKLKRYIPQIINAFRRNEARNSLPRSISGIWKADLFLGGKTIDRWLGTTVKINPEQLVGASGLRVGIYPKRNSKDIPRLDDSLNLLRIPLPYDGAFMEAFYKSFFLVRAFLRADAKVPAEIALPDAEDRFVTRELEQRREFAVSKVVKVLRDMAQSNLLSIESVTDIVPAASLSEFGLSEAPRPEDISEIVSIAPFSFSE